MNFKVKKAILDLPNGERRIRYLVLADDIPMGEINQWLEYVSRNSYLTGQSYAHNMVHYLKYLQSVNLHYKEVTKKQTIDGFIKYLLGYRDEHVVELTGKRSINTVAKNIGVIKNFYDWLEDRREIEINPVSYGGHIKSKRNPYQRHIRKKFLYGQIFNFEINTQKFVKQYRFKETQDHIKWYTPEEVQRFIDNFTTVRDRVIFRLSVECGLRIGEILGLRKTDIDRDEQIIKVKRYKNYENAALAKSHERDVPILNDMEILGDTLITEIENYLTGEREQADIHGSPYLFLNHQGIHCGLPMRTRNYLKILKIIGANIGIDPAKIRSHSGRSTRAQDLVEKSFEYKIPEHFIKTFMGWKSIDTLNHYADKKRARIMRETFKKLPQLTKKKPEEGKSE